MIFGYARVSTEEQAYQVALSNQIKRLRESGCHRIYADVASRNDNQREGILSLMKDLKAGLGEEVRITRLDRITASPTLFEELATLLNDKKIPLIGLDEYIDISSADGEFSAGLQIYFGRREVKTIQMRSQRGHEARRQNKRPNPSVPWGFRVVDRSYKLNTTPFLCLLSDRPVDGSEHPGRTVRDISRDVVDIFFQARSLTKTVQHVHERYGVLKRGHAKRSQSAKIASYMVENEAELRSLTQTRNTRRGIFQWTHDGLARWLRNPVLRGHTPYGVRKLTGVDGAGRRIYGSDAKREEWQIERDTHPDQCLITEDEYRQIEQIIAYNAQTRGYSLIGGNDRRRPISGLLVCGACGSRMKSQGSKQRGGKWQNYYRCKASLEKACTNTESIRSDRAEALIIKALVERAEAIAQTVNEPDEEISSPELLELQAQLRGLQQIPGSNSAIEEAKTELQGQIERLGWSLRQKRASTTVKQVELVETLEDKSFWEELEAEKKGELFRWLVKRVLVNGKQVQVELDV